MLPNTRTFEHLFGARLQRNVPLARYTSARVGGAADVLIASSSAQELAESVTKLWEMGTPFVILGGGSNVLVSDRGVHGVVLLNRAKSGEGMRFNETSQPLAVWAESGVSLGMLARLAAAKGLGGLEWAAGIPGTLGGAVAGNAGAHGGDIAGCLRVAEILQQNGGRQQWEAERLEFGYRSSLLKRQSGLVVLAAELQLAQSTPEAAQAMIEQYTMQRHRTQPPGASMGSMFKNPPGDFAGRLIEAAGLKGVKIGGAEISPLHANFFINRGQATASDVYKLIQLARQRVKELFGVTLELEIELIGDWVNV